MKPPESWNDYLAQQFGIGRASFHVFDFTGDPQHPLGGHYWVLAQFSKSRNRGRFRKYGRGFWEVVPKHRFASAADLEAHIRATNPSSHFTNDKDDNYWYQLATTGEKLVF